MSARLRIAGIAALGLAVLGAAARPFHQEITPSKAFVALVIILPCAFIPAMLVRYALARRWLPLAVLAVVAMIGASALIGLIASTVPVGVLRSKGTKSDAPNAGVPLGNNPAQHAGPTHAQYTLSSTTVVLLLIGLAVVVALAIVVAVRRRPAPAPVAPLRELVPEPKPEEIARRFYSLLDDTLEDLRNEPDPRRAVIAAYARMERGLAVLGTERMLSETPFEYLERVLERLSVSEAAARRLTDLFQRAKFSPAPVGAEMKEAAVAALEAIREEARAWAA